MGHPLKLLLTCEGFVLQHCSKLSRHGLAQQCICSLVCVGDPPLPAVFIALYQKWCLGSLTRVWRTGLSHGWSRVLFWPFTWHKFYFARSKHTTLALWSTSRPWAHLTRVASSESLTTFVYMQRWIFCTSGPWATHILNIKILPDCMSPRTPWKVW